MAGEGMTSRERVMAALRGERTDICPAVSFTSVATIEGMKLANAAFPQAHTDGAKMAELAAVGHDVFGFDTVAPYYSVLLEAAALGARVDWGDMRGQPHVCVTPFCELKDISVPVGYMRQVEMQQLLRAIRILRKKYRGEVAVIGKVMGPWTLAYNLYGVEKLVLDTILEPQETKGKIRELSRIPVEYAKAQFEAGADAVTWAEHVTRDLVSAQLYREFVYEVHCEVCRELRGYGPLVLHVCGNVEDRFPLFAETGFDCFHMDSRNDTASLYRMAGSRIQLAGAINNPITLMRGTASQLEKEVLNAVKNGVRMIGPECAIQTIVPVKNLKELVRITHRCKSI